MQRNRRLPGRWPACRSPYLLTRAGAPLTTEVTWAAPSIGQTLLDGWSVILFSLAFAGVAAFVFARRPDEPAAMALDARGVRRCRQQRPWFLGVTVSDVVQGRPVPPPLVPDRPAVHAAVARGPAPRARLPAPLPVVTRRRWLVPLVYALSLGGYVLAMLVGLVASPTWLDWVGTWATAQAAVVVPVLALALGLFVSSYVRARDPVSRTRLRWVTIGLVASAGIGLVAFWIPELVVQHPLLPASWIGLVALPLPLGVAAGILFDRLFDIDVVVNRTLVYGGLTLGVVATYVADHDGDRRGGRPGARLRGSRSSRRASRRWPPCRSAICSSAR